MEGIRSVVDVLLVFADPVVRPLAHPYGPLVVQQQLERLDLRCEISTPYSAREPVGQLAADLARYIPRIVGFSFRNLDSAGVGVAETGTTFLNELRALVELARSSGALVVLGGSGFSIAPNEVLSAVGGDVGFVGPAEHQFAQFANAVLRHGASVAHATKDLYSVVLPGVRQRRYTPEPLGQITRLHPAYAEWARITGETIPIRTKSGCSLRCTYCAVPHIEPLRLRPVTDICAEVRVAVDAGLGDSLFIADGEFNLPDPEYARQIVAALKAEFHGRISWRCYVEAGFIPPGLAAEMAAAGCGGVSLTADSFSDTVRKRFAKRTDCRTALTGVKEFLAAGVVVNVNLLFGGPGETLRTAVRTARVARALVERGARIAASIGLTVYPGTPLAKMSRSNAFSAHYEPSHEVPWLGYFCSPVSRESLYELVSGILPPSSRVQYTRQIDLAEQRRWADLGLPAEHLAAGNYTAALEELESMRTSGAYPSLSEIDAGVAAAHVLRFDDGEVDSSRSASVVSA